VRLRAVAPSPHARREAGTRHGLRIVAILVAVLAIDARAADWQVFSNATWVAADWNDGDSFSVALGRSREIARLYFVDCPEATAEAESDRRRLLEQSRYFGIEPPVRAVAHGRAAAARTRELLSAAPFVVHTAFARAPGRSGKARVYAMITLPDGRDLAAVLVEEGLARAFGVQRALPDGTEASEYARRLADLELAAAVTRRGVWADCLPERIADLRRRQREEARSVDEAFGIFEVLSADHPLDVNACSSEELQNIRGIGPVLADRIVKARPFTTVDDLRRVEGLGATTLERMRPYVAVRPAP